MDKGQRRLMLTARLVMRRAWREGERSAKPEVTTDQYGDFLRLIRDDDFRLALAAGACELMPDMPAEIKYAADGTIIEIIVKELIKLVQWAFEHREEIIEFILALIVAFT